MAAHQIGEGTKAGASIPVKTKTLLLLVACLSVVVGAATLPDARPSLATHPTDLTGVSKVEASAGWHDTCALLVDSTVRCWGDNIKGSLGDNTAAPYAAAPVEVCASGSWAVATNGCLDGIATSTLTDVQSIAVGGDHACALSTAGGVKCWGSNSLGQLGDSWVCGFYVCKTPQQVVGLESGVVAISAGLSHTCALVKVPEPTVGFRATCWGYNHFAQLGDNHVCGTHICTVPVQPVGLESGVSQISAGSLHTCVVLTANGEVLCWGYNADGQLGDGTTAAFRGTPVNVCPTGASAPCLTPLQDASSVAARGLGHSCALMAQSGSVKCWGANDSAQLGVGTTTPSLAPVDVCAIGAQAPCGPNVLTNATAVAIGFEHGCALFADTTVACWGANDQGQLGDGQPGPADGTPVAVCDSAGGSPCAPLSGVQQLSSGFKHNCALMPDTGVNCWGANDRGELGDNSTFARPFPVTVTLDSDRDGCTDAAEEQTAAGSEVSGGQRDPFYFWDFFDVWTDETNPATPENLRRDQIVLIVTDLLAVAARFGAPEGVGGIDRFSDPLAIPPPAPAYHPAFDRGVQIGPNPWDLGPPDGTINIVDDILGSVPQYAHSCRSQPTTPPPTPTATPGDVTIDVGEFWFCDPSYQSGVCETTIDVGQTVLWDFAQSVAPHTSTDCGDDCDTPTGSPLWDSGILSGGTFAQTFDSAGTFLYYCAVHPDTMRGRVVVNPSP